MKLSIKQVTINRSNNIIFTCSIVKIMFIILYKFDKSKMLLLSIIQNVLPKSLIIKYIYT